MLLCSISASYRVIATIISTNPVISCFPVEVNSHVYREHLRSKMAATGIGGGGEGSTQQLNFTLGRGGTGKVAGAGGGYDYDDGGGLMVRTRL